MSILRLKPIPDLGFFMEQLCAKLARSSNIYFYFRPTWSKVKFLKSHTPKDNFIPIWDEVKTLRFKTFRQVVGKFFCKNQSPADCRGLMRNLISASVQLAPKLESELDIILA